jgi:predicted DNA-binding transcriptional regulator AlpA
MSTRPCSHLRRTPQLAEESVDQRRRSRFTITGFSALNDNRNKILRTRVSYEFEQSSRSCLWRWRLHRNMPQPQKHTAGGTGKTTSRTYAEAVSAEKSPGVNTPIENSRTSHADTVIGCSG